MKILKIFGIVVGIHVFALILIFANPGCSSTTNKPAAPVAADTAAKPTAPAPVVGPASSPSSIYSSTTDSSTSAPPIAFNPDAPATSAPGSSTGGRMTPTRPGSPVVNVIGTEPVTDVTPATSYTVKSGDNLWTIATKNKLTVAQLTAANNLPGNASLRPGQKLLIPGKPTSMSSAPVLSGAASATPKSNASAPVQAANDNVKHVVKSGESLSVIAQKYNVRMRDLAVLNNISDPLKLRPGVELIIPAAQSPTSKSSKATPKASSGSTNSANPASTPPATEPTLGPPPQATPAPSPAVPVIKLDDPAIAPKQP